MNREIIVCALHYVSLQLGYGHPNSDQGDAVMQFILGRNENLFATVVCH